MKVATVAGPAAAGSSLVGLNTAYLVPGEGIFAISRRAWFDYDATSTAPADNLDIFAPTSGGGRFHRRAGGSSQWRTQATWYVDPAIGNNDYDGSAATAVGGASLVGPLKTDAERARRVTDGVVSAPVVNPSALHSTATFTKFAMYWPRKSPFPDWWTELSKGNVTWSDVDTDLAQMKSALGINAVRVFTYYDNRFRQTGVLGWTNGTGTHNATYLGYLSTFIDKCAALSLDVIVTMYQLLPALLPTDNWSFLESSLTYYQSFHTWMLTMLATKSNVRLYNLMNEPDGFGVGSDDVLFGRVLTFLGALKATGKSVAPNLLCMVNCTTHDNNFKRYPLGPAGQNSIYDLSDILALNTFLWADTGFWSGQSYRSQTDFIFNNNLVSKPAIMTECGFPAHYGQQAVAGTPILNEAGVATGGNSATTDDSIVPQGNIFDRPKGVATGVPHNTENQARGIAEAAYWAREANFAGLGVWAAYDHRNDAAGFVYRDAFGVIDRDGTPLAAAAVFKAAMTGKYDSLGEYRISLGQGTVSGLPTRINGYGGYDAVTPAQNTPAGVYIHPGGGWWQSDPLTISVPWKLRFDCILRAGTQSTSQPFTIRVTSAGASFDFRYKVYAVNAFQRLDVNGDVDYGFAQTTAFQPGAHSFTVDLSGGLAPRLTHNGTLLVFDPAPHGDLAFPVWQTTRFQIRISNPGNLAIDLIKMTALGPVGGVIPFMPKKPRLLP